jgi:putative transposase
MPTAKQAKERTRPRAPVNTGTASYRVSDKLWSVLQPVVPMHENTHRFGGGRPRVPDRQCADAIFYVLRTGCQWGALDATDLCPHSTAHDRFQAWVAAGVLLKLWQAGVEQFDELKGLDWSWLSMDGAMTKAPLGGGKNRPQSHGPGQERRQTQPADRGARGPRGRGGSRGQPT